MSGESILNEIIAALKGELGEGFSTIKGFVERQGKMAAKQAAWIAKSRISGTLANDDEFYQFFLDDLERNATDLVKHIAMLTALTVEKAWNAVVNVLWGGIRSILSGAGVPGNLLPETPPFSL